jgi:hypothetical protein
MLSITDRYDRSCSYFFKLDGKQMTQPKVHRIFFIISISLLPYRIAYKTHLQFTAFYGSITYKTHRIPNRNNTLIQVCLNFHLMQHKHILLVEYDSDIVTSLIYQEKYRLVRIDWTRMMCFFFYCSRSLCKRKQIEIGNIIFEFLYFTSACVFKSKYVRINYFFTQ